MANFGHGGNAQIISRKMNINFEDIIDFSANINPLGMPESVKSAIIENLNLIEKYPDISYFDLKKSISKFENIKEAEWWITKEVATEEDMELIQELYAQEMHVLNDLMFAYMDAEKEKGLSEKRKKEYDLLATVRGRKAKDKPM